MSLRARQRRYNAGGRGVRISVTVSPIAADAIERLHRTGLWGLTRAAVIQGLIYAGLREAEPPRRRKP